MPRILALPRTWFPLGAIALFSVIATVDAFSAAAIEEIRWLNPRPQGCSLTGISFASPAHGFAVGTHGTSLFTSDGGATWLDRSRPLEFSTHLRDVIALDATTAVAVGEGAGIFRTTNAGVSWHSIGHPGLSSFSMISSVEGRLIAVGDDGAHLLSSNGGITWTDRGDTGLADVQDQFWFDVNHGYLAGDGVVRTTNGGASWQTLTMPGFAGMLFDVTFADANNGWVFAPLESYRTTDGGTTWFQQPTTPHYLFGHIVLTPNHRLIASHGEGAQVWETLDDGVTWTMLYDRGGSVGYLDFDRLPDGRMFATSTDGDIIRSADNGLTWTNATLSPDDLDRTDYQSIRALSDGEVFALGTEPDWLRSHDAGLTWTREPAPGSSFSYLVEIHENGLGFTSGIGSGAQVARTSDRGQTWTQRQVSPSTIGALEAIDIVDAANVFLAYRTSGSGKVFRSTDGGLTFAQRSDGIHPGVEGTESIFFLDPNVGFVGGGWVGFSYLYRTTDAGATWSHMPLVGLGSPSVYGMYWSSISHGVLATTEGLLHTSDGGASWTMTDSSNAHRVFFEDPMHGAAIAFGGSRLRVTEDGGVSWTTIDLPIDYGVLDGIWNQGEIWLSGLGSRVLSVTLHEPLAVPGANEEPALCTVSPNPVSGQSLRLEWESTRSGSAGVAAFSADGRLLAAADFNTAAGWNEVIWNVPDLPSGVAFVRVQLPDGRTIGRSVVVID